MGQSQTLREKVNMLNSKILMPLMALSFILFNTVINLYIGERIETIQNLLAIAVLAVLAFWLLSDLKAGLMPWLRQNILVIGYFAARAISCVLSGFDYTVIRSIFFEVFYLIGISKITLGGKREFYVKAFMVLEMILNAGSLLLYYYNEVTTGSIQGILSQYTYFESSGPGLIFNNINNAGILAGFSVVLAIVLYGRKKYNKILIILFGIFNVIALILFGCRSAEMGVIFALIFWAASRLVPKIKKNIITMICLVCMILTLIPIYGFINYNIDNNGAFSYTETEAKLNDVSTGRYLIWKECIITQSDDRLFGAGSINTELQERAELVSEINYSEYWRYVHVADIRPHNGYLAQISISGWIGFALFAAILMQRLKKAEHLQNGRWYLLAIFSFVLNCVENLFVLSRSFTCFYMLLILETDMEQPDEPKKLA